MTKFKRELSDPVKVEDSSRKDTKFKKGIQRDHRTRTPEFTIDYDNLYGCIFDVSEFIQIDQDNKTQHSTKKT